MRRLRRACIIGALLVIAADAGRCPFLCLLDDTAVHESSNVPPQPNQCGGMCGSVLTADAIDAQWHPTADAGPEVPAFVVRFGLAPTFDIDHSPRVS